MQKGVGEAFDRLSVVSAQAFCNRLRLPRRRTGLEILEQKHQSVTPDGISPKSIRRKRRQARIDRLR